jgi:radical SAM protein with 4Fe4S-binding SPASM domain
MPTAKILEILDQARDMGFQGSVCFHFYSEPFLDDRSVLLAREARGRGLRPFVHTNGDVLRRDPELCRLAETEYEYVVIGIYDYQSREALEESKRYWRERLPRADLRFSYIGDVPPRVAPTMAIPRAIVPPDSRVLIPDLVFANAPCHRPLSRMIIRYDGEMSLCCEDTRGEFRLGNVYEATLEELWHSERHIKLVRDLITGHREAFGLCRGCPLSPTGPPRDGVQIGIKPRRWGAD